jgi:hypothetical protein
MTRPVYILGFLMVVALGSCNAQRSGAGGAPSDPPPRSDSERLQELQRAIEREIGVPRAGSPSECKTIGFGSKPCGGPVRYLVYSTATTDAAKLERLVGEFNRLQQKINRERGLVSDCMLTVEPQVELVDGVCKINR